MEKQIIYFSLLLFFGLTACKKETTVIVPPIEPASCILKESNFKKDTTVQVWSVIPSPNGFSDAIKINKQWKASLKAFYWQSKIQLLMRTYIDSIHVNSAREFFALTIYQVQLVAFS